MTLGYSSGGCCSAFMLCAATQMACMGGQLLLVWAVGRTVG
jgi:hypothetical protein